MKPFALVPLTVLALAATLSVQAQEAAAPEGTAAPAEGAGQVPGTDVSGSDFTTGEPVQPETRVVQAGKEGDWEVRCIEVDGVTRACQMFQGLKESADAERSVAEITVVPLPEGNEAAAGAELATPLGTLLTPGVTFAVDGSQPRRYPYTWCDPNGCYSRIGFLAAELDQLRRGKAATVTIVPMAAQDQKVNVTISLTGFTAAFNRVMQLNAEAAAANPGAGGN